MEGRDETVVFALDRVGATAMAAAAEVGLEGAPDEIEAEAGLRTLEVFRQTLANDPDAELLVVGKGVRALGELMSHDPDMLVIDESDGVGLIDGDAYRDLFALLQLLRDAKVEVERDDVLARVRKALDDVDIREAEGGIDGMLDLFAVKVADEFCPRTLEGSNDETERTP